MEHTKEKTEELLKWVQALKDYPLSQNLAENEQMENDQPYERVLEPYVFTPDQRFEGKTFDYKQNNPNLGWKFHLNIPPEHVIEVSDYLKQNQIHHKFLSGGKTRNGKLFTLYIGSFSLAQRLAERISSDLSTYLRKPKSGIGEIEFAAGVIGRFNAGGNINSRKGEFDQYGSDGFSLLQKDTRKRIFMMMRKQPTEEFVEESTKRAFKRLLELYGSYFLDLS